MRRGLLLIPLLALLTPASAGASMDCATAVWDRRVESRFLPAPAAVDVPTDSLIWSVGRHSLSCEEPLGLALLDEDGEDLALVEEGRLCADSTSVIAWRPLAGLEPGATYTITPGEPVWPVDEDVEPQTFTVGEAASLGAPEIPGVVARHVRVEATGLYGPCGGGYYANDHVLYDLDSDAPILLLAGGAERTSAIPETPWASLASFSTGPMPGLLGGLGPRVGLVGSLPPTTRVETAVGAMDLAGNFSGWSETDAVTMPAAGCHATKEYDQAWLALVLLLLGSGLSRLRATSRST